MPCVRASSPRLRWPLRTETTRRRADCIGLLTTGFVPLSSRNSIMRQHPDHLARCIPNTDDPFRFFALEGRERALTTDKSPSSAEYASTRQGYTLPSQKSVVFPNGMFIPRFLKARFWLHQHRSLRFDFVLSLNTLTR